MQNDQKNELFYIEKLYNYNKLLQSKLTELYIYIYIYIYIINVKYVRNIFQVVAKINSINYIVYSLMFSGVVI